MRLLVLSSALLLPIAASAQASARPASTVASSVASPATDLHKVLLGDWTGVLEYRDYQEPPSSTKRVQLPTWLSIAKAGEGLSFLYIYDDGPNKTVTSRETVVIDLAAHTYKVIGTDALLESSSITGNDKLRGGLGDLVVTGKGLENDQPSEIRTTIHIGRNLLTILKETRPESSTEPFVFRHRYVFTRATAPQPNVLSPR